MQQLLFLSIAICLAFATDQSVTVGHTPNWIEFCSNESLAFVSNYGITGSSKGGSVSVVDLTRLEVIQTLEDDNAINHPTCLAIDGETLYIANSYGFVSMYDLEKQQFLPGTVNVPYVRKLLIHEKQKKLYATQYTEKSEVAVISTVDHQLKNKITMEAKYPTAVVSYNDRVFVTHQGGKIVVLDATNDSIVAEIPTPEKTHLYGAAIDHKGERLFVSTGSVLGNKGGLLVYSLTSYEQLAALNNVGSSPNSIVLSHDCKRAYIIHPIHSIVTVLDTESYKVIDSLTFDCNMINFARLSSDDKTMYITCPSGQMLIHSL